MDYQAGTSSSKIVLSSAVRSLSCLIACLIVVVTVFSSVVFAQTTTNPLVESVTLEAAVLVGPGTRPDTPPSPSPGPINMTDTTDAVIFKGYSYPGSTISILKNSAVISSLPVNPDGTFELHVKNLLAGTYSFGVKAEDASHLTSKLLTFTVYVSSGVATVVEGIFMPPTITSDKVEVKKGEGLTLLGSSVPSADVRISFSLLGIETLRTVAANASGTWSYVIDTSFLSLGDYEAKARSLNRTNISLYSDSLPFRVGSVSRMRSKITSLSGFRKRCDLNDDNRVNLLDFSIMAFWYKRLGFPDRVDLNSDRNINLTDLSILAYCWTG